MLIHFKPKWLSQMVRWNGDTAQIGTALASVKVRGTEVFEERTSVSFF